MTSPAQSPLWLPSTLKGKARVSVVACQALAYLPKPLSPVVSVAPPHWPTCCSWLCQALQPQDLSLLPRSGSGVCHPLPPKPVPAYFPSAEHLLTLLHMCLPLEGSCQLCTWMAPSPQQPCAPGTEQDTSNLDSQYPSSLLGARPGARPRTWLANQNRSDSRAPWVQGPAWTLCPEVLLRPSEGCSEDARQPSE